MRDYPVPGGIPYSGTSESAPRLADAARGLVGCRAPPGALLLQDSLPGRRCRPRERHHDSRSDAAHARPVRGRDGDAASAQPSIPTTLTLNSPPRSMQASLRRSVHGLGWSGRQRAARFGAHHRRRWGRGLHGLGELRPMLGAHLDHGRTEVDRNVSRRWHGPAVNRCPGRAGPGRGNRDTDEVRGSRAPVPDGRRDGARQSQRPSLPVTDSM